MKLRFKYRFKLMFMTTFYLCCVQISVFAQTSLVDDEISALEKRLIELKEKKIREHEEAIQKIKNEINGLKEGNVSLPDPLKEPATLVATKPANTASLINASLPIPSVNPVPQDAGVKCSPLFLSSASFMQRKICEIARITLVEGEGKIDLEGSLSNLAGIFAEKISKDFAKKVDEDKSISKESLLFDSEKKRTDKQVGASPNTSGTTSLVVKGGGPAIIAWAVENGAATSSLNGNTVTVRVNPYNFANVFFRKQSLVDIKDYIGKQEDPFEEFLKKTSLGFSFDTTRGTDTPILIVSKQQLSSWSARYEFINRRNPLSNSEEMTAKRNAYFAKQAPNIDAVTREVEQLFDSAAFEVLSTKWINNVDIELAKGYKEVEEANPGLDCEALNRNSPAASIQKCREKAYEIIEKQLENNFPTAEILANADMMKNFSGFNTSIANFRQAKKDFLDEVNKGTVVAFEYTNHREVNAPDTSNFRFIAEKGVFTRKPKDGIGDPFTMDFTINAEMTVFHKKPSGSDVKRIKDFNLAMQLDVPMKDMMLFNDSILSFAFRYTRQNSDIVLPNGVIADGTKGDILFGQGKLTIPIGDTGIKLPISFTFANRSEFIKERVARTNFGLTFDLDQLFKFGPFSR